MFTDEEIRSREYQIESLVTSIHELENQINILKGELSKDAIEFQANKFGNPQKGDEVIVTHNALNGEEKEVLFFEEFYVPYYYAGDYKHAVHAKFAKRKADGTKSVRTVTFPNRYITSIEKVTK